MRTPLKHSGRRGLAVTASLLTAAAMLAAVPATSASADVGVSSDQFSLGLAPEVTGSPGVPAGYIRLWDMAVAWRDVNPAPGVFNWTVLDQRIAQVEAAGAKVLYVAGLTPVWAAANPADGDPRWGAGSASAPADPATYSAYITALMSRYGGRIAAIEAWNEANLKTFWTGSADQMADLTQRANSAVKSISGGTQVFAASTTTRLLSSVKTFFGPYAAALKARGYPMDGWTIHTYPAANAGPVARYDGITAWKGVLSDATNDDATAMNKAVWDTEVNYGLAGPGSIPDQDFDGPTGATFVARTYVDSIRQGVDSTFWYLWTAGPYGLVGVQMYSGTGDTIGAYNRVRSWTAGATFKSCDVSGNVVRCFFDKGGPFIIAMSKSGAAAAWNGSPTLTAEQWDGQVVNPAGALSLAIGPVKFSCGADKSLCTPAGVGGSGGSGGSGGGTSGGGSSTSQSITITGSRVTAPKPAVVISGTTSGFDSGSKVTMFVKYCPKCKYVAVPPASIVSSDGSFTWTRKTPTKLRTWQAYAQIGTTKSAVITIPV